MQAGRCVKGGADENLLYSCINNDTASFSELQKKLKKVMKFMKNR
jgi:hypothetical protein